jgi:hypothetical protein
VAVAHGVFQQGVEDGSALPGGLKGFQKRPSKSL